MSFRGSFKASSPMRRGRSRGLKVLTALLCLMWVTPSIAKIKGFDSPDALKKEARAKFKASFDLAHDEIFSPLKEGPLHYAEFYRALEEAGGAVTAAKGPVTGEALFGLDTYIILGPAKEFGIEEIEAISHFVREGGNLLIALHISWPVARLTEAFGIIVSNFTISESSGLIGGKTQDFYVTRFLGHPVTAGVKKVAVYGTWGLVAEGATLLAETSDRAWADLDRNRRLDEGEPVQSFGIIAVREYGKGKVVVVADDAPFANTFLDAGDNRKLITNIIRWFRGGL